MLPSSGTAAMSNPQLFTVITSPGDTSAMNNVQLPFPFSPVNELSSALGSVLLNVPGDDNGLMFRPPGW
jgi:hypothetical protein